MAQSTVSRSLRCISAKSVRCTDRRMLSCQMDPIIVKLVNLLSRQWVRLSTVVKPTADPALKCKYPDQLKPE